MSRNTTKGFTLIELLVVIAIIGILSSVVMVSLNSARGKSRDAYRRSQLSQLRSALELYNLNNNSYPNTNSFWYSSEPGDVLSNNGGDWIPGLAASGAISSLPRDPLGGASTNPTCAAGGYKRAFYYRSDGNNYKLLAHCGPEGTMSPSDGLYDPIRPTWAWKMCSGEPACSTW